MNYFNWFSGEPNGGSFENAIHISGYYKLKWTDVPHMNANSYAVCIFTIPETVPDGYIYSSHDWGQLYTKKYSSMTKADAKAQCAKDGATLPMPLSKEENDFYRGLHTSGDDIWLGISDEATEGVWVRDDGTEQPSSFMDWHSSQPNIGSQGETEDGAIISLADDKWHDVSLTRTFQVICVIFRRGMLFHITKAII